MTHLPTFISELVRAANTVEKLSVRQRRRLFGRAYAEVMDSRAQAWRTLTLGDPLDLATSLLRATGDTEDLCDDKVKELLLDAAEMIRGLKIALDQAVQSSEATSQPSHPLAPNH